MREIITELEPAGKGPNPRWAICTSATNTYATAALQKAGIPKPEAFVVSEDVEKGKPEYVRPGSPIELGCADAGPRPDPYLLGAKKCGVDTKRCLVVEDAPAGVKSGRAAGCKTLALLTSHTREQIETAQPDFVVKDLSR